MNTLNRRAFLARVFGAMVTAPLLACVTKPEPQYHIGMDLAAPGSDTTDHYAEHWVQVGSRANAVCVKWTDRDGWMHTECVEDPEGVCRDGYWPIVVSYSCSSREQAMRHGRWVLMQERIKS